MNATAHLLLDRAREEPPVAMKAADLLQVLRLRDALPGDGGPWTRAADLLRLAGCRLCADTDLLLGVAIATALVLLFVLAVSSVFGDSVAELGRVEDGERPNGLWVRPSEVTGGRSPTLNLGTPSVAHFSKQALSHPRYASLLDAVLAARAARAGDGACTGLRVCEYALSGSVASQQRSARVHATLARVNKRFEREPDGDSARDVGYHPDQAPSASRPRADSAHAARDVVSDSAPNLGARLSTVPFLPRPRADSAWKDGAGAGTARPQVKRLHLGFEILRQRC